MGGLGSDAAIEAADVVIMTDEPSKVSQSIDIAKKTMKIVKENTEVTDPSVMEKEYSIDYDRLKRVYKGRFKDIIDDVDFERYSTFVKAKSVFG